MTIRASLAGLSAPTFRNLLCTAHADVSVANARHVYCKNREFPLSDRFALH